MRDANALCPSAPVRHNRFMASKWHSLSLPQSILDRLDLLVRERGSSRARVLGELLADPRPQSEQMTEVEFRQCLEERVRAGMGAALKLWADLYLREEPAEVIDEFDAMRLGFPDSPLDRVREERTLRLARKNDPEVA